jgi:hypothetical protein
VITVLMKDFLKRNEFLDLPTRIRKRDTLEAFSRQKNRKILISKTISIPLRPTKMLALEGIDYETDPRLIKLNTETVEDLKRLRTQMGAGSLDELLVRMIQLTDAHRLGLKEVGWSVFQKR